MSSPSADKNAQAPTVLRRFRVEVVYCHVDGPVRQTVELTEGDTVEAAIGRARFHERFRELDLQVNRIGIFGNIVSLKTVVRAGDRVEVYRPITCDPETVERRDNADSASGDETKENP